MKEEMIPYKLRLTEWAAVFLMIKKYIPGCILEESRYFAPRWMKKRTSHDSDGQLLQETLKFCGACGEWFPPTSAFFSRNQDGKQGLHSQCKWCKNGRGRVHYEERIGAKPRGYRRRDKG